MPQMRLARQDDIDSVVALVESAYRGDASRVGWTTEADLIDGQRTDSDAVHEAIEDHASRLVLLVADGGPISCYRLERRPPTRAYFGMFCVRPDRQGGGIGRTMLADAEQRAGREWEATELHMTVIRQRSDLIAWYEWLGYRRTGDTAPFPYGDERYGRPTRPDLEFVYLAKRLDEQP